MWEYEHTHCWIMCFPPNNTAQWALATRIIAENPARLTGHTGALDKFDRDKPYFIGSMAQGRVLDRSLWETYKFNSVAFATRQNICISMWQYFWTRSGKPICLGWWIIIVARQVIAAECFNFCWNVDNHITGLKSHISVISVPHLV